MDPRGGLVYFPTKTDTASTLGLSWEKGTTSPGQNLAAALCPHLAWLAAALGGTLRVREGLPQIVFPMLLSCAAQQSRASTTLGDNFVEIKLKVMNTYCACKKHC